MDRWGSHRQSRIAHEDQLRWHQPGGNLVFLPHDARELQTGEGNPGNNPRVPGPDRGEVRDQTDVLHVAQGGADLDHPGFQNVGWRVIREPTLRQNARNWSGRTQHPRAPVADQHGLQDVLECRGVEHEFGQDEEELEQLGV